MINKFLEEKKNGYHITYHDRNAAEGFHGFVKKYLNLQNYFDYQGLRMSNVI